MALTTLRYLDFFPAENDNSGTTTGLLMDSADEKVAFIFRVRKTGTIDRISVPMRTVTVSDTLKLTLQTVDGSGDPTGTLYGGSAAQTFTPVTTVQNIVTMATGASATAGDLVAVVIEFNSFVAGNLNISYQNAGSYFPYMSHLTGGSWSKKVGMPGFGIGYSDGTYENVGAYPGLSSSGANVVAFNSGSTPNERALLFKLPFPARISGCSIMLAHSAGANFDIILYDFDGVTILTSLSVVANQMDSVSRDSAFFTFPTSIILSRNKFYRLAVKPTTANDVTIHELTFANVASMDSVPGGQNCYRSVRTSGGAWTDLTTTRPRFGLILNGFDNAAGTPHTAYNSLD